MTQFRELMRQAEASIIEAIYPTIIVLLAGGFMYAVSIGTEGYFSLIIVLVTAVLAGLVFYFNYKTYVKEYNQLLRQIVADGETDINVAFEKLNVLYMTLEDNRKKYKQTAESYMSGRSSRKYARRQMKIVGRSIKRLQSAFDYVQQNSNFR